jgi:two-component system, NtrC family, response regulator AtoC
MLIGAEQNITAPLAPSSASSSAGHFIFGLSPAMRALKRVISDIAPTEIPVLLIGESGTGKEMAALEIHRLSGRANEPFLKCNCAASGAESLQSRLCGGENGAKGEAGRSGGTLFLDEVSLLDPSSQLSLLHCLPDGDGTSSAARPVARVISATTRNLEEEMRGGRFREELYYRIDGVCLRLPSLRSRKEDIAVLLDFFVKKYVALFQRSEPRLAPSTMDLLMGHSWPGNVRELENVARKIVALGDEELALSDLSSAGSFAAEEASPKVIPANCRIKPRSLKEAAREASRKAERELIAKALERTHWNRKRTARDLQVSYKALLYKMKQLGLDGATEPELA